MPTAPFDIPRLKIDRGRAHATDLEARIADYLSRDPWAVLLQKNTHTGEYRIAFKGREPVPTDFPIIFGDAIHNFRTALDVLANDVVTLDGVQPVKVYFPFGKDREGFERELKSKLRQASPEVQAIVRAFKPYTGGCDALRALHDLDIEDKHLDIISADARAHTGALPIGKRVFSKSPIAGHTRVTVEADFSLLPTVQIDLTGFPADADAGSIETIGKVVGSEVDLSISKGFPLAGRPVLEVLDQLSRLAERIVDTFAAHFDRDHELRP